MQCWIYSLHSTTPWGREYLTFIIQKAVMRSMVGFPMILTEDITLLPPYTPLWVIREKSFNVLKRSDSPDRMIILSAACLIIIITSLQYYTSLAIAIIQSVL